ncbi:MAG: TIGR00282 family metallophosphoesterase [Proteobacteria bacterium]|nr:TIGR00282 family metallophosphoesterase [Pseudomonadota bacterium]
MRILFLGDVVGRPGRTAIANQLPALRQRWRLDCVVINGENAAGGFGITEAICDDLLNAGADAVTLGNHAFDQREALVFIERQPKLVRPLNFPRGTPGRGAALIEVSGGRRVLVINAIARVFMGLSDDPFAAIEREVEACPLGMAADAILVDFHGEATSEKQALGHYLDGRVSVVVGTHTHVPTADARRLPGGTAYQSDAGMCGDYDSVLGCDKSEPIRRFLEATPGSRFESANGSGTLCGLAVETDDATGLAVHVSRITLGPELENARPAFWE